MTGSTITAMAAINAPSEPATTKPGLPSSDTVVINPPAADGPVIQLS